MARLTSIDLDSLDPRPALNVFLWNMDAARKAGMLPKTEYEMIEKLARGEVQFLYYSTAGGTFSIMESRDNTIWDDDFGEELLMFIAKTAQRRAAKRRDLKADMRRDMVEADLFPTPFSRGEG